MAVHSAEDFDGDFSEDAGLRVGDIAGMGGSCGRAVVEGMGCWGWKGGCWGGWGARRGEEVRVQRVQRVEWDIGA